MSTEVPLKCECGLVRGKAIDVDPSEGNRLVCMCDDCQTYAHYLGRSEAILDENGGTDVFQMTPAQIVLTQGHEHVRCVRLTKKGLMRWYASCCNTPIANTVAWAKLPFAGVLHPFMDHKSDGRARDEVLGPILARVQARFGHKEMPPDAYSRAPVGLLFRSVRVLIASWLKGRQTPSPFFDPTTGKSVVEPTVVDTTELAKLRELVRR